MFLDWVSNLRLLDHSPDTHILKEFPVPVRQVIVSEVVRFILSSSNSIDAVLTSESHVVWVMECVGAAFSLPISNSETILSAIEIYRQWSLDKLSRPAVFDGENEQFFVENIIKHYSLIFEPRTLKPTELDQHAALCAHVLAIYSAIASEPGLLTEETWITMLKLLLGAVDGILRLPEKENGLAQRLCKPMLQSLFELWFLSGVDDKEMWGSLLTLTKGWNHWEQMTIQWACTLTALTTRTLSLLYSLDWEDSVCITLPGEEKSALGIHVRDDLVYYAFVQTRDMVGDPNHLDRPSGFLLAFRGIQAVVDVYVSLSPSSDHIDVPTGNTILNIFGDWLFTAVMMNRPGFEEGTAVALETLCNIFYLKKSLGFYKTYLARFYAALKTALKSEGHLLYAAVLYSNYLLSTDMLPGNETLTPWYAYAAAKILSRYRPSLEYGVSVTDVRNACIQIVYDLIPLTNHFGEAKFQHDTSPPRGVLLPVEGASVHIRGYRDFKPYVEHLLVLVVDNESPECVENIRLALGASFAFAAEYMETDKEGTTRFLNEMLCLLAGKAKAWPLSSALCALEHLALFSKFYHMVDGNAADFVMAQLALIVKANAVDQLTVNALYTMVHWFQSGRWLGEYADTLKLVRDALLFAMEVEGSANAGGQPGSGSSSHRDHHHHHHSTNPPTRVIDLGDEGSKKRGKRGKKTGGIKSFRESSSSATARPRDRSSGGPSSPPARPTSKAGGGSDGGAARKGGGGGGPPSVMGIFSSSSTVGAARYAWQCFLNCAACWDANLGSTQVHEAVLLEKLLEHSAHPQRLFRYFCTHDSIVCVVDRPDVDRASQGECCTLIVRNAAGRFSWNTHAQYHPYERPQVESVRCAELPELSAPFLSPSREGLKYRMDELTEACLGFMGDDSDAKTWLRAAETTAMDEAEIIKSKGHFLKANTSSLPPAWRAATSHASSSGARQRESCIVKSRMFLANTGLGSTYHMRKMRRLKETKELFYELRQLDALPERETISCGVIYMRPGQVGDQVFSNAEASESFGNFLSVCGWGMNPQTSSAFKGGLQNLPSIKTIPYYHDASCELVFLAAPALIAQDVPADVTAVRVRECSTLVVWTEESLDTFSTALVPSSSGAAVYIVVHPLSNKLFQVATLYEGDESVSVGPLSELSVVGMQALGALVRHTCIHARLQRRCDRANAHQRRAEAIQRICGRFQMPLGRACSPEGMFLPLRADQTIGESSPRTLPDLLASTSPRGTFVSSSELAGRLAHGVGSVGSSASSSDFERDGGGAAIGGASTAPGAAAGGLAHRSSPGDGGGGSGQRDAALEYAVGDGDRAKKTMTNRRDGPGASSLASAGASGGGPPAFGGASGSRTGGPGASSSGRDAQPSSSGGGNQAEDVAKEGKKKGRFGLRSKRPGKPKGKGK